MSGIGSPWFFASLGYRISRGLEYVFLAIFTVLILVSLTVVRIPHEFTSIPARYLSFVRGEGVSTSFLSSPFLELNGPIWVGLWLLFAFLSETIRNVWVNKCLRDGKEEGLVGLQLPERE